MNSEMTVETPWLRKIPTNAKLGLAFIVFLAVLAIGSNYALHRGTERADQAASDRRSLLASAYELAILYSPDGGYARLAPRKIDNQFADTDPDNNAHLAGVIRSKYGSDSAEAMAHYGFLAGDSEDVAHANMDEARRRIQIAKHSDPNDIELYNEIEKHLLGLK